MRFQAAVIQMTSGADQDANWACARELVEDAAREGARFVASPENTNYLGRFADKVACAEPLDGPTCTRFAELARELSIHILLGSFNERSEVPGRCHNTSVLFGPGGARLAVYRKIHLFDINLSEVSLTESAAVAPGTETVAVGTDLGCIGLSICYDLRFAELYLTLARAGAELVTVPSAFTVPTGRAHWDVLTRARAIEFQCYVLAPAQFGRHDPEGARESYGHARIVDPWGKVLAEVPDGVGFASASIDLGRVRRVRGAMPVAEHRRL